MNIKIDTDIVCLTTDIIGIPSFMGLERQEEKVAEYILEFFRKHDIEAWSEEAAPGRPNVYAKLPGTGMGNSLMLCGHTDTVPAYDMKDAFSPRVTETPDGKDRIIYGRGACDMKGALAAMMSAMVAIKNSGNKLSSDLYFAALADEEDMGIGVEKLVRDGPVCSAAIVGEPTGMNVALGHKGLEWIKIAVRGKKVHGGNMDAGVNAVVMASKLIDHISSIYYPVLRERRHDILGHATINVGVVKGGDQPSTVPDYCEISLDRRYIPGESREQVYRELDEIFGLLKQENPDFDAEILPYHIGNKKIVQSPFCTDAGSGIVLSTLQALEELGIKNKEITSFPAWTDGGTINNYTDSEVIIMGPGELSLAHTVNESITDRELYEAADIYAMTALKYCGTTE